MTRDSLCALVYTGFEVKGNSMAPSFLNCLLLGAVSVFDMASSAKVAHIARDGSSPTLTHDPATTSFCTWWVDLSTARSCFDIVTENDITLDAFRRWVRNTILLSIIASFFSLHYHLNLIVLANEITEPFRFSKLWDARSETLVLR